MSPIEGAGYRKRFPRRAQFSDATELGIYDWVIETFAEQPKGFFTALLYSPVPVLEFQLDARLLCRRFPPDSTLDRLFLAQVVAFDSGTTTYVPHHGREAVEVGVPIEAIRAIRDGSTEALTDDQKRLAEYVRQITFGEVTDESYAWSKERFGGERAAVEFVLMVLFHLLTVRLQHVFTERPSDADLDEVFSEWSELQASYGT